MRKRNWKEYNRQLIERGSLIFLIDPKLFNSKVKGFGKNGRPQESSLPFITMLMMVKIHFRLTYRSLEGFMKYLADLNKWKCAIPSYSLICKRAASIRSALSNLSKCHSSTILVNASGTKVVGEGEWKIKIHGTQKRRKWVKIHIAIDAVTQEIVAEKTTKSSIKDGKVLKILLDEIKDSLADVIADRDDAVLIIRGLGGDKMAKSIWGRLTGYSIRALVETAFSRMKRLFGERLFSKIPEKQAVENRLRCVLLNKMRIRGNGYVASALD